MKSFLKFALVFLAGLIIGGVTAFYISNNQYKKMLGNWALLNSANDITLLQQYRENNADGLFNSIEKGIPETVLLIEQKKDVMDSFIIDMYLRNAKTFYKCTKTTVPGQIKGILDKAKINNYGCTDKNNE